MTNIYILFSKIELETGGLTKAMLGRANVLSEFYNVTIITFSFKNNIFKNVNLLYESERLSRKVSVKNFYFDFFSWNKDPQEQITSVKLLNDGGYEIQYFISGVNIYSDFFDEKNNRTSRLLRNNKENLSYLELKTGKIYLVHKTECNSNIEEEIADLKLHWLNSVLSISTKGDCVMGDSRYSDHFLSQLSNKKVKKILLVHSIHLSKPYQIGSTLEPRWNYILPKLDYCIDDIVFLTDKQKDDFKLQFNTSAQLSVISHPSSFNKSLKDHTPKNIYLDHNLVLLVCRLSPGKDIPYALKIFSEVIKIKPEAKLKIFGKAQSSDYYKTLEKLRYSMGLKNNVTFEGYSNNIEKEYQKAACTIVTSEHEGFCLTIIESMMQGTPVISNDFNYGPRHIIKNEKNGYIVPIQETQEFVEKIISIIDNPQKREMMSVSCLNALTNFDKGVYLSKLSNLIERDKLKKPKAKELNYGDISCKTIDIDSNMLKLRFNCHRQCNQLQCSIILSQEVDKGFYFKIIQQKISLSNELVFNINSELLQKLPENFKLPIRITAGNKLFYIPTSNKLRSYRFDNYFYIFTQNTEGNISLEKKKNYYDN